MAPIVASADLPMPITPQPHDEIVIELLNGSGVVVDQHTMPIPHALRDTSYLPQLRIYYRRPVGHFNLRASAEFATNLEGRNP